MRMDFFLILKKKIKTHGNPYNSVMVTKLDYQASEFASHWVLHKFPLVPQLSKAL